MSKVYRTDGMWTFESVEFLKASIMWWMTGLDPPMFQMPPWYWRPSDNQIDPYIQSHNKGPKHILGILTSWFTPLCLFSFSSFKCLFFTMIQARRRLRVFLLAFLKLYRGSCCCAMARRVRRSLMRVSCYFHSCICSHLHSFIFG